MSISTYSQLQTAVANWLHRSDLTTAIPDFIALGEARIYRELRVRAMETALNSAISSGVVAVPSGYLELKNAYLDTSPVTRLTRKSAEWIYQNYPTRSADAKPLFIARDAGNFIFGPYPGSSYTVKGVYYKRLDSLSDSNTTNWLTSDNPDLILFASLVEAAPYLKNDARAVVWETKYQLAKSAVQRQDEKEAFSGSVLSMSAG